MKLISAREKASGNPGSPRWPCPLRSWPAWRVACLAVRLPPPAAFPPVLLLFLLFSLSLLPLPCPLRLPGVVPDQTVWLLSSSLDPGGRSSLRSPFPLLLVPATRPSSPTRKDRHARSPSLFEIGTTERYAESRPCVSKQRQEQDLGTALEVGHSIVSRILSGGERQRQTWSLVLRAEIPIAYRRHGVGTPRYR